ncbi:hypothetical protein N8G13_02910 [Mycoplasma zalophi]|uniref:OppA family ABC transporter substrate-binding lipoprotein n=1 Tax=Mycoplasma zalophi TaxID=191287 RepID=UPI0021C86C1F|nr:hypothetical protein [Mycoplasma zalophi]MCU4117393.1 hypothetical protein [Mycoplasma zalophi]
MKLKKIFLSSILLSAPIAGLFAVSCKINNFLETNDQYIETYNFPNDNNNFSIYNKNNVSKKINNLISTKLFRIVSQDKPAIDFVNNKILKPSKMFLKFEQASRIQITWNSDENDAMQEEISVFDKDTIKDVSFDKLPSGDPANPDTFLEEDNPTTGYANLYKFIESDDSHSINSKTFKKALKNAKKIEIFVLDNKNPWLDAEGNKINETVKIQDFKLGFLRSIMLSKNNRTKILKNPNLILQDTQITKNINYFNQDDILEYLKSNNINIKPFLNPNFVKTDKPLTFELETDGSFLTSDWSDVFRNLFLLDNVTDAIPSFKFSLDFFSSDLKNYDFLYEYGKTYQDLFYSSYYFVTNNTLDNIKLYKNKHYINNTNWQNQYRLNEINFKFNVLPINSQTFNIQTFNAFNQNLNSSLNFNNLDELQKQDIMNNFEKYNLNYFKNYQMYNNQIPLIINLFPHSDTLFFNNAFSRLYFGLNKNELKNDYFIKQTVTKDTIVFRSLINNVINPYVLSSLKNSDVYLSQAPSGIFISANDIENTNYKNLIDAAQQISKQIIFDDNLQKINKTTSFENKQKAKQLDNITNYNKSLESVDFYQIQQVIKPILDNYFNLHKDENTVNWTVPLDNRQGLYSVSKLANFIKNTFKNLDKRLEVEIKLIENDDQYNLYFKNQNSIYNENNFQISTTDTNGFLYKYLTQNNYKNLLQLIYIWDVVKDTKSYPEISQFIRNLQTEFGFSNYSYANKMFDKFKYSDFKNFEQFIKKFNTNNFSWNIEKFNNMLLSFITNYSKRNITFTIVNLINEIANALSYTISIDNYVSLNNYSKNLLQKYIIKPASYYNLEYLQDILILNERIRNDKK